MNRSEMATSIMPATAQARNRLFVPVKPLIVPESRNPVGEAAFEIEDKAERR